MTVIRPNSISGVTSITAQGGNINVFRADGTAGDLTINNIVGTAATFTGVLTYEDVANVDSVGVITARGGINLVGNDLNVGSNIKIGNASGIVTATTFSGSGASLTNIPDSALSSVTASKLSGALPAISGASLTNLPAQATIANNADNRIITGGSGVNLNGESTLTYSGDTLLSTNSNFVIKSIDTNASNSENYIQFNAGYITYDSDASNSTGYSGHYFQADGAEKLRINGSGQLIFDADTNTWINRPAADTLAVTTGGSERLRIHSDGKISTGGITNPQGVFCVDTGSGATQGNTLELRRDSTSDYHAVSFFTGTTCDWSVGQNSAGSFDVYEDGSDSSTRFTILSGGNTGVGIDVPAYTNALFGGSQRTLHVSGSAAPMIRIQSSTSGQADLLLQAGNSGSDAYIANAANNGDIVFSANNGGSQETSLRIYSSGNTQIYNGDLLLGPDSVSQMEATIRAWGCSLWYTTIDGNYYHDSGGEFRQFYNKGSFRGDNYLTAYNCPIQTGVGPQNRNFWKGAQNDTRAEGTVDIGVGYRGAWFFISRTCPNAIRSGNSGKYLYDSNSPNRVSVSFDSFGNNIDTQELSFHCGSSAGYNSGDATLGGRLGSSDTDSTLRMYAVGVNMENYNAPNSKRAGNHLGISVINEDGTDYTNTASRLSTNLINNSTTGGTHGGGSSTEFNWGNRHSNDRGYNSAFQFSQLMYFDDVQLNSAQWDYLEHYFKVMYG